MKWIYCWTAIEGITLLSLAQFNFRASNYLLESNYTSNLRKLSGMKVFLQKQTKKISITFDAENNSIILFHDSYIY